MGDRFPMTGTWPVDFVAGQPGYDSYVNPYIRIRFWNQVGALVADLGKWPCWLINGKTYEFNCVTHVLAEVSAAGGHIVTKRLKYDTTFADIPVTSVPQNSQGQVQITARNDGTAPAMMGINFTVKNPSGSTVQTVSDQSGYVEPGADWLFGWYSTIPLSQTGTYTIQISVLVWNGSQWVPVDQWSGNLCTVAGAPVISAAIVEQKLNYGGADYDFGVTVPLNTSASVKITIRNDSAVAALLKLIWIVVKPDGSEAQYYENQTPYLSPGELLTLQGGFITLNPDGTWSIGITLLAWDGSAWVVVDSWPAWLYGTLCTVQAGVQPSVFSNFVVTYAKL
jgi:hypothetical protein